MKTESASIAENEKAWEMPYGMCWLLLLAKELQLWACATDPSATAGCSLEQRRGWSSAVDSLAAAIVRPRVTEWLVALVAPDRGGAHRNTAFSLSTLLDASRGEPLEGHIIEVSLSLCL